MSYSAGIYHTPNTDNQWCTTMAQLTEIPHPDALDDQNLTVTYRTMDFSRIPGKVVKVPEGETHTSYAPNEGPGLQWTSLFGFIGVQNLGGDHFSHGLNTAGLGISVNSLACTVYQSSNGYNQDQCLQGSLLPLYLLGNCATSQEAAALLEHICVWQDSLGSEPLPGFHFMITDAKGESIVIEYLKGKLVIMIPDVAVMTNDPSYEFYQSYAHFFNGQNNSIPPDIIINDKLVSSSGPGSNAIGIPGGWTPSARFAQALFNLRFNQKPQQIEDITITAHDILSQVWVPLGEKQESATAMDATRFSIAVTHCSKGAIFAYFHRMNQCWVRFQLNQLDFGKGTGRTSTDLISMKPPYIDGTSALFYQGFVRG